MSRSRKPKPLPATGQVRIIAGKFRGRKLPVLDKDGLRPTTDRVKETLFNWLMPYSHDAVGLDCFAGTGSLGFEALSRGAQHLTFIELDKIAARQISANVELLKADNALVLNQDIHHFLQQPPTMAFDLVFIDPPFRKNLTEGVCQQLSKGWLAPHAIIYLEREKELHQQAVPNNWRLLKEKIAGQVCYQLYQYQPNDAKN